MRPFNTKAKKQFLIERPSEGGLIALALQKMLLGKITVLYWLEVQQICVAIQACKLNVMLCNEATLKLYLDEKWYIIAC